MVRILSCVWLALSVCCAAVSADTIVSFSDESSFQQAVQNVTIVTFDVYPPGFSNPPVLVLGDVTVTSTAGFNNPIFAPGPFGFTSNFLSTGVQDGSNNVLVTFPPGATGAGMQLVSAFPVTVTATSFLGASITANFSSGSVSFLGFVADSGIASIRISSPYTPQSTPIVNVGNISYGSNLAPAVVIPTLSGVGFLLLMAALLLAGLRSLRSLIPER